MSPNEDAYVHRQLGELAEGMRGLQQSPGGSKRAGSDPRTSRTKSGGGSQTHGRACVTRRHFETGMSDMKPVTDDVKRWKLMGIGALGVIGIGGIVLGVTFADAKQANCPGDHWQRMRAGGSFPAGF